MVKTFIDKLMTKDFWHQLLIRRTILFYKIIFFMLIFNAIVCRDTIWMCKLWTLTQLFEDFYTPNPYMQESLSLILQQDQARLRNCLLAWESVLQDYSTAVQNEEQALSRRLFSLLCETASYLYVGKLFLFTLWLLGARVTLFVWWIFPWIKVRLIYMTVYILSLVDLSISCCAPWLSLYEQMRCALVLSNLIAKDYANILSFLSVT